MATDSIVQHYVNFVGGLSTEASPLSFPENTAKDLDNVDLQRNGSVKRRLNLELENDAVFSVSEFLNSQLTELAIKAFEWRSVDGDGDVNFLVLQIGTKLYFHNLDEDSVSLHPIGSLDFTVASTEDVALWSPVDMAQGRGALFVVGRYVEPFYVRYNADDNTFTGFSLTLRVRDTDGLSARVDTTPIEGEETVTPPATFDEDIDFNFEFDGIFL